MTIQTIWTALPNSYDANNFYFSVFVSHRLSGGATGTLKDYPLGSAFGTSNWAEAMASLELVVSFDGGVTRHPAVKSRPGQPNFWTELEPKLWEEIFPPDTTVQSYVPQQPSLRKMRTFPAAALVREHAALYNAVAATATEFPLASAPVVSDFVSTLGRFQELWQFLDRVYAKTGGDTPGISESGVAGAVGAYDDFLNVLNQFFGAATPLGRAVARDHYLAWRFYRRNRASQYDPINHGLVTALPVPKPEYHQLLGMLGDHPTLLRKLGIVLDFAVARRFEPAATGLLQVTARWPGIQGTQTSYPQTRYRLTKTGFFAAASGATDLLDGYLVPSIKSAYQVVQTDVDGHAQKMIGYGLSAGTSADKDPDAPESLPARRNGGLTLMKGDRAKTSVIPALKQIDVNNAALAANKPVVLEVSDVTRGYRVDVWDGSGAWKSVCRRQGEEIIRESVSVALAAPDTEGLVKALGATRGDPSATAEEQNTLYVHEAVFGWDGWSLCASRPGRGIGHKDHDENQAAILGFLASHPAPGFPVRSEFQATPKSLPRLRYGTTYAFRVRLVDLGGSSLAFDHDQALFDPNVATTSLKYLRHDPVAPPALVFRLKPNLGESLESIVIRSNPEPVSDLSLLAHGTNAEEYSATAVGTAAGFLPFCERHVAPPKTSQIMVETHGLLDGLSPIDAFRISAKEAGTFTQDTVYDLDTGALVPLPAGELVFDVTSGPPVPPPPMSPPGQPMKPGQIALHTLDTLTLPYLPDPLARGVTFRFPPADPTSVPPLEPGLNHIALAPFVPDPSHGWPRVSPFRLIIRESTTANMTYARAAQTFAIGLPPATLQELRFSSVPHPAHVQNHAVWDALGGDTTAEAAALRGLNWMLSPYRELLLVHAVQRPLLIPTFQNLSVTRNVGNTFVLLRGAIQNDGRSTVHVDVNATWLDPYDDVNDPTGPHVPPDPCLRPVPAEFTPQAHAGRAFEVPVDYADTITAIGGRTGSRHEFGDTKHRWVTYSPDATSRYREYFPPPSDAEAAAHFVTEGVKQVLNVLSSKRPDPIEVLYTVPTFKWQTSADGTHVTRIGRGIRVYFARPWFKTGADELVGVLLLPEIVGPPNPNLAKYTSEWGRDPVWTSTGVTEPLGIAAFTNRVLVSPEPPEYNPAPGPLSVGPFALAEDPEHLSARVIAFQPEYNADRNLWFVDIEMDHGTSYFPFVRLALVRFQPHSIFPGTASSQHLSRVTRTEFIQLVPDRTASVTYAGNAVQLTVSGISAYNSFALKTVPPVRAPDVSFAHNITAQVQQRPRGSTNDLLWAAVSPAVAIPASKIAAPDLVTWSASVTTPAPAGGFEYRLLVKETESYIADSDASDGSTGSTPRGERLVYACGIALDL